MPSTCAVSGNLQDLTGANLAGFAVFKLANYGSNVPRVIGTTVIASPQVTLQANGSGVISGNIWGNDVISPAGSIYLVTIEDVSRTPIQTYAFSVAGTTFNLNSALPVTAPPTVALGSGAGSISLTGQTATLATQTMYQPTANILLRFTYALVMTVVSGNASTLTPTLTFYDGGSGLNLTQTFAARSMASAAQFTDSFMFYASVLSGHPVSSGVTLTGPIGAGLYSYYARLEAM